MWYLLRMIVDKYIFIHWIILLWRLKKKKDEHHLKLNQYQQLKKEKVLFLVVVYHHDDTIMEIYLYLCVDCVVTRLS